jgi:hypothetical protein
MRTPELLKKLFDLERSIGVEDETTIRGKIIELEEHVLLMQRDKVGFLRARCDAQSQSPSMSEEPIGFKFIL